MSTIPRNKVADFSNALGLIRIHILEKLVLNLLIHDTAPFPSLRLLRNAVFRLILSLVGH